MTPRVGEHGGGEGRLAAPGTSGGLQDALSPSPPLHPKRTAKRISDKKPDPTFLPSQVLRAPHLPTAPPGRARQQPHPASHWQQAPRPGRCPNHRSAAQRLWQRLRQRTGGAQGSSEDQGCKCHLQGTSGVTEGDSGICSCPWVLAEKLGQAGGKRGAALKEGSALSDTERVFHPDPQALLRSTSRTFCCWYFSFNLIPGVHTARAVSNPPGTKLLAGSISGPAPVLARGGMPAPGPRTRTAPKGLLSHLVPCTGGAREWGRRGAARPFSSPPSPLPGKETPVLPLEQGCGGKREERLLGPRLHNESCRGGHRHTGHPPAGPRGWGVGHTLPSSTRDRPKQLLLRLQRPGGPQKALPSLCLWRDMPPQPCPRGTERHSHGTPGIPQARSAASPWGKLDHVPRNPLAP